MNINDDQTWQKIRRIMIIVALAVMLSVAVINTVSGLNSLKDFNRIYEQNSLEFHESCQPSAQPAHPANKEGS